LKFFFFQSKKIEEEGAGWCQPFAVSERPHFPLEAEEGCNRADTRPIDRREKKGKREGERERERDDWVI
jgi:hypothetical protein